MQSRPGKQSFGESTRNKYHEADIQYTLQMSQWVLTPIGMWSPIHGFANTKEKIISLILIIVCFCTLCFVLIPVSHYTLFEEQDMNAKVMLLGAIGYCITTTIKYYYISVRATTFGQCIKHIETDWRMLDDPVHRSIMLKNVAIGRSLTIMCALLLYTAGLFHNMALPLMSTKTIGNVTYRALMYPGYDIFFDVNASPTYEILFSFHFFYGVTASNITIAACNLAATFVTHACGQIQIQMHRLGSLVQLFRTQSPQSEDPLTSIVKDHIRILRFTQCVEEVLREICLLEIVFSTLIMCLLEYYCIAEWYNCDMTAIVTYCILLISVTFNMLIFCYIGELLVEQGAKIGEACYAMDWYNLPSKRARLLLLLIMISSCPLKLSAGKMFDLSLNTFSAVVKSSVAYLNMLRTITE